MTGRRIARAVQAAAVWLLLGAVVFAALQWRWQRAQASTLVVRAGVVEIHRGTDGQYHWPGRINGRAVDFLVDTGASGTAISTSLAHELKLAPLGALNSRTAGGVVHGQLVSADISLRGGVTARRLRIAALPALGHSALLGMDVLGRLTLEQRDGVLRVDLANER
jgi:aspartyl protease family protein